MNNFKFFLYTAFSIAVMLSCERPVDGKLIDSAAENPTVIEKSGNGGSPNAILIQSKLSTFHCAPLAPGCVCQEGDGSSPDLGDFDVHLNFCVVEPFPEAPTDPIHYEMTLGESYVLANDQEYYIRGSGTVFPVDHPHYDAYFKDEFEFYQDGDGNTISGFLKLNSKVYDLGLAEQETKHIVHGFINPGD